MLCVHALRMCTHDSNPPYNKPFVLQEIERNEDSWPFKTPVSREEVPDYYEIIKVCMEATELEVGTW